MLDAKHLKLRQHNLGSETTETKLLTKDVGPFEIETMTNNKMAELLLPRNLCKLHPSFNTELLNHSVPNPTKSSGPLS